MMRETKGSVKKIRDRIKAQNIMEGLIYQREKEIERERERDREERGSERYE